MGIQKKRTQPYGDKIPRYKCAYCGKSVGRYGSRARKRKLHFCNRDCQSAYIKENHGLYDQSERRTFRVKCTICGRTFDSKMPKTDRKYCDTCRKLISNYIGYKKYHIERDQSFKSLKEYCKYIVENNFEKYEKVAQLYLSNQKTL